MIISADYANRLCKLVFVSGAGNVKVGDNVRTDMNDEQALAVGGAAPQMPAATGRIQVDTVQHGRLTYYPSVYGCKWVRI